MYATKEHSVGLWILEEKGQSVLFKDSLSFALDKHERIWLFQTLQMVVAKIQDGKSVTEFIQSGVLKPLDQQKEVEGFNVWEIRNLGRAGRVIFVRKDQNSIIVAAVNKGQSSHSQAIRRGIRRWKNYLKSLKK